MPTRVLDQSDITRALSRIAHEILEREKGAENLVLLGIPSRGVPLAHRIAERIAAIEPGTAPPGGIAGHHHVPRRPAPAPGSRAGAH